MNLLLAMNRFLSALTRLGRACIEVVATTREFPLMAGPWNGSAMNKQETAMFGLKRPETPFPRHWLYYMILKLVVLAAAVLLALYLVGIM